MELTEFVSARLDEDEAVAREAAARPIRARGRYSPLTSGGPLPEQADVDAIEVVWYRHENGWSGSDSGSWPAGTAHFERFDPARALAQVEALRKIVTSRPAIGAAPGQHLLSVHEEVARQREYMMRHIASIWADHPDFDPAWEA